MAKNSPLSRWSDRPVLKDVRFRLSLDGPHLASDQRTRIQGDRTQLDLLADVVAAYVQQVLSQPATQFGMVLFGSIPGVQPGRVRPIRGAAHPFAAASPLPPPPPPPPPFPAEQGRSLVPPDIVTDSQVERNGQRVGPMDFSAVHQAGDVGIIMPSGLALLPKGRLKHELWLGPFAEAADKSSVVLSTLELFDLANAFDQYRSDTLTLPETERAGWLKSTPVWMRAAAAMIFAAGVTASLTQILQQTSTVSTLSGESETEQLDVARSPEDAGNQAQIPTSREEAGIPGELEGRVADPPRPRPGQAGSAVQPGPGAPAQPGQPGGAGAGTAAPGTATTPPPEGIPPELAAIPPVSQGDSVARRSSPSSGNADNGAIASAPAAPEAATLRQDSATDAAQESFSAPEPAPSSSIPQVSEVQRYVEQRWQPPDTLDRAVEYRLLIAPNGSLQQVTPLGATARSYSSQIDLPAIGQRFVSPLESDRPAQVRLILQPNGEVRTFLESWN